MLAGSWVVAAIGLALLNVLLLGTVGFVWLSNYRTFRTPLLFGLVGFAAVMLVENLVVIYSLSSGAGCTPTVRSPSGFLPDFAVSSFSLWCR